MTSQSICWKEINLGELCEFKYGKSLPQAKRVAGKVPVYGSNGVVGYHTDSVTSGMTIIVGRKGSFGEVNLSPVSCWPIDTTYYIDKSATDADIKWLAYRLQNLGLNTLNKAAAVPGLNREDAYRIKLLLPPIAEQKRIAAILDKAEELRELRRQALRELDAIAQSIFIEMFGDPVRNPKGWNRVPFSELLAQIESGKSPNCLDRPAADGEWGVLKLGAVTWCEYNPYENKALPPNEKPDAALEIKKGDLLFTRKNTYELVAACALVRSTLPRLLLPDLIFRFRLKSDASVDLCFLHQLLTHPAKRREIQKLASGSASSMPNISKTKLQAALLEIPPLSLQQEFGRRIESIQQLKTTHRESLAQLDTLFASLQNRAFRGEL